MYSLIFFIKVTLMIIFQNYSIKVVDDLGYNLGSYLISDEKNKGIINGEIINFSDF